MRKITYGCSLLFLMLLFLSGCGAQANEPADHNEMAVTATPTSSSAADENAQETEEAANTATPSISPTEAATPPSEKPVKTEEPKETEKTAATQKPAATEKAIETKQPKATAAQPKSTPKAPVKTEAPVQPKETEAVTVHTVEITNFAFSPEKLEISQGDIVNFINKDEVKHTATADDGQFDTDLLAQNASKKVTFTDAGEFGYYCTPHPGMRGTIVVKEK
ncbi:cupredoxin domain-containing protein [Paenibacillus sp. FJAT-27812]|uniref:cupredoxin domain-containing protein n=1 Tax=Paenibacillus sp. FJAT-27812 TaxID=1684143 RepID=UPI0006A7E87C|nr:cupredoxin family copper-binding protein [Paenibacillus sp. FJAT-27812]